MKQYLYLSVYNLNAFKQNSVAGIVSCNQKIPNYTYKMPHLGSKTTKTLGISARNGVLKKNFVLWKNPKVST